MCGITRAGDNGPWSDMCVANDCDNIRHRWMPIEKPAEPASPTSDPAVAIWLAAIRETLARNPRQWTPDRRTPRQIAIDDAREAIAEARADFRNYDLDAIADENADRYEKGLGL